MAADDDVKPIAFKGRTAKRADSRERRLAILKATLRVITREGMRGVRHRAIAKEADVPLAATTYYFKDINELISDAFNLFAEDTAAGIRELADSSFDALKQLEGPAPADLDTTESRAPLAETLIDFIVAHIDRQVGDRDRRILEHAFRNEALRNELLAQYAEIPKQQILSAITQFFTLLKSPDPEADAHIVNGVVLQLEYELLTASSDRALIRRTISRLINKMVAI